ncbi:TetR/AcrR family transcriptional regulator [Arthrobacter russicus]|uniref:TetR/AcrR family transcriptional regulator n=1 Tax=Arthrobacter russicus TaxID=172040 RepID=UPI003CFAD013
MTNLQVRRRGRVPTISRESVARAAIGLGFEDLTMSTVAASLGVKHSSLYRHVGSRDDLVSMAIDLMASEAKWPTPGADWREYLEKFTDVMWTMYEEFPGVAPELQRLPAPPSSVVYIFAASTEALIDFGFDPESAVLIVDTISALTIDSYMNAYRLRISRMKPLKPEAVSQTRFAQNPPGPLNVKNPDGLEKLLSLAFDTDGKAWWLRKRALLLDGISARLSSNPPGSEFVLGGPTEAG